ncbi:MAG: hypothetical protein D9C04_04035 [Nitrosopumilus sp. B06]|nr:MAG: hypothetical protein D9C04_04035 [Nitrosopumilus sp. B06]
MHSWFLKVILDVPMENLRGILSDRGWDVVTVTEELGSEKESRSDTNILRYAQDNDVIVATIDRKFVCRLREAGVKVVTLDVKDKADIMDEKLKLETC